MKEPLIEYIVDSTDTELSTLFNTLDVIKNHIICDTCQEQKVFESFMLALWKSVKIEEIK